MILLAEVSLQDEEEDNGVANEVDTTTVMNARQARVDLPKRMGAPAML